MTQLATASSTNAMTDQDAALALRTFLTQLRGQFAERTGETRGILLALISRSHVFFGGPPGTAKSALVNSFAKATGSSYFQRLLMRQSVPEELFGPQDLLALRDGRYERRIGGFLPTSEFVFLDECFKASPAILNALLTVMNERQFDQGSERIDIPLQMLAGASNELPDDPSLGALWDRFLLRFWVQPIADEDTWESVLFADEPEAPPLSMDALERVRALADRVDARTIAPQLRAIRRDLAEKHGIAPSDRRWKQAIKLIRAMAALDGRDHAVGDDLLILADCLWEKPRDRAPLFGIIAENANPALTAAMKLHDAAHELVQELDLPAMRKRTAQPQDTVKLSAANSGMKRLYAQIEGLPETPEIAPLQSAVKAWADEIAKAGLRAMGIHR